MKHVSRLSSRTAEDKCVLSVCSSSLVAAESLAYSRSDNTPLERAACTVTSLSMQWEKAIGRPGAKGSLVIKPEESGCAISNIHRGDSPVQRHQLGKGIPGACVGR